MLSCFRCLRDLFFFLMSVCVRRCQNVQSVHLILLLPWELYCRQAATPTRQTNFDYATKHRSKIFSCFFFLGISLSLTHSHALSFSLAWNACVAKCRIILHKTIIQWCLCVWHITKMFRAKAFHVDIVVYKILHALHTVRLKLSSFFVSSNFNIMKTTSKYFDI